MGKMIPFRPYTINMVGDNDAEINMYGEIVEEHPTDWWTGEPIPGNFIALDDFLADLDGLRTKDNITVHINSVGGSLYAGVSIYNRLKELPANVVTINDGLAASAASVIFQAGNPRKVNAGSCLMIHEAAVLLMGYYQNKDLKTEMKRLDAHNRTAIAAYAEATGIDSDTIKSALSKETWMTGQEAVDAGYADEVIDSGGKVSMSLSPDKRFIVSNGVAMSARGMGAYPTGIKTMTAAQAAIFVGKNAPEPSVQPAQQVTNKKIGGTNMDKITTMEALRDAYPDLVSQVEAAAKASEKADGIKAERARIQGIEAIEAAIGDKEMVREAKYGETPMTAEQLAFKAMQAQAAIGATVVKSLEDDAAKSGAAGVAADPAGSDPKAKEEDEEVQAVNLIAGFRPKNKKEG
nr:MAG TPA: putative ATP dependent Clp protease [Caudoviricetes sp.]